MKLNEHFFSAALCGTTVIAGLVWGEPQVSPFLFQAILTATSALGGYCLHTGITHEKDRERHEIEARKEYEKIMAEAIERRASEVGSKPGFFP